MFDLLTRAEALLEKAVTSLDPEVLEAKSAARLVDQFARMERLASAGKSLAARRMAASGVWKKDGDRSAAHWVARHTGTSLGQAVGLLDTAERLAELPATEQAVRKGKLSEAQAKEVASAAAADPTAEKELLKVAQREGLTNLRHEAARIRAAAESDELDRYDRIFRSRYLRHWSDSQGAFRLDGKLTPDAGAVVVAALEPFKDKLFSEARRQGRRESYDAYGADALVALAEHVSSCNQNGSRKQPKALVRVLVDHKALKRGFTKKGEVCELEGIGPIPVATAKALATDSILAALALDGTDIATVSHLGRSIPARMRTAIEVRDPCCAVFGCGVRDHLEIDHLVGVAEGGKTTAANLKRWCKWHHYLKTHKGFRPVQRDGRITLEPPPEKGEGTLLAAGSHPPG